MPTSTPKIGIADLWTSEAKTEGRSSRFSEQESKILNMIVQRFCKYPLEASVRLDDLHPGMSTPDIRKARTYLTHFFNKLESRFREYNVLDSSGQEIEFSGRPKPMVADGMVSFRVKTPGIPRFAGISFEVNGEEKEVPVPMRFVAPSDSDTLLRVLALRISLAEWKIPRERSAYDDLRGKTVPKRNTEEWSEDSTVGPIKGETPYYNGLAWGVGTASLQDPIGTESNKGQVLSLIVERVKFADIFTCRIWETKECSWTKGEALGRWLYNNRGDHMFAPPLMSIYVNVCVWLKDRLLVTFSETEKHWTCGVGGLAISSRMLDNMKDPHLEEQAKRIVYRKVGLKIEREDVRWIGACLNHEDGAAVFFAMVTAEDKSIEPIKDVDPFLDMFERRPFREDVKTFGLVPEKALKAYLDECGPAEQAPKAADGKLPTSVERDLTRLNLTGVKRGPQWRFFNTAVAVALAGKGYAKPIKNVSSTNQSAAGDSGAD